MAEVLTSRDDAKVLKREIYACIDRLEALGFTRLQIGSAMSGVALGVVHVNASPGTAMRIVNEMRDLLVADGNGVQ